MNVRLIPPITITLDSAKLLLEDSLTGIVEFQINEQPQRLVLTYGSYIWDTTFASGDRVRLIESFGTFGLNSSGILQEIIIDTTDDKADVLFDTIYPNQVFSADVVETLSGNISILFRVPLRILEKI